MGIFRLYFGSGLPWTLYYHCSLLIDHLQMRVGTDKVRSKQLIIDTHLYQVLSRPMIDEF